jgi:GT2 family glycosyltransferase
MVKGTKTSLWPVAGYEDAPLRKRLAYFRPWLEERRVRWIGRDSEAEAYGRALAAEWIEEGEADTVFAAGMSEGELRVAHAETKANGCAFVGWTADDAAAADATLRQSRVWPFVIASDEAPEGAPIWASEGPFEPLSHPSVGIVLPTHAHPQAALEAAATLGATYPGPARFAIVANAVAETGAIQDAAEDHPDRIAWIASPENLGFARGCNAGLRLLTQDPTLEFLGVCNDDVLPGEDCLYEIVHAFSELEKLGHRPGAIGPVSNEVNGAQRVELGAFRDAADMRGAARRYWRQHRSSAHQTLQVRGLLLMFSRSSLHEVGGFDPRFGIGNFEDDDHNLRTRLAGFSLWIAGGAFLFHHGSSTFRTMKVDYEANIRRNAETMMRKWQLSRLEEWIELSQAPPGTTLYQPFDVDLSGSFSIRINGETVDLIHQASDMEFAAWLMGQEWVRSPEGRKALLEALQKPSMAA